MRSKRSRNPSHYSGSFFLYSPVRLWIVLLFDLICSDRQLTYPVYQILHFLIRFVKICFSHNLCTQPHHHCLLFINSFIPLSKDSYPAISVSFKIIPQNLVPLVREIHKNLRMQQHYKYKNSHLLATDLFPVLDTYK